MRAPTSRSIAILPKFSRLFVFPFCLSFLSCRSMFLFLPLRSFWSFFFPFISCFSRAFLSFVSVFPFSIFFSSLFISFCLFSFFSLLFSSFSVFVLSFCSHFLFFFLPFSPYFSWFLVAFLFVFACLCSSSHVTLLKHAG